MKNFLIRETKENRDNGPDWRSEFERIYMIANKPRPRGSKDVRSTYLWKRPKQAGDSSNEKEKTCVCASPS